MWVCNAMRFKTDAENLILDLTVFADFSLIASNKTISISPLKRKFLVSGLIWNFFVQNVNLENDCEHRAGKKLITLYDN